MTDKGGEMEADAKLDTSIDFDYEQSNDMDED